MDLTVKINNNVHKNSDSPLVIVDAYPTISWEFIKIKSVVIDGDDGIIDDIDIIQQFSYEIRIADDLLFLGKNSFMGNVSQTGIVEDINGFWVFKGSSLIRGRTYYGQVRVIDNLNRETDWHIFSFRFNSLPEIISSQILPVIPTVNDNLQLSYIYYDDDGDGESNSKIIWYKNGVLQYHLNDSIKVDSGFLQVGDIWSADIIPSDSHELGEKHSVSSVTIVSNSVVLSGLTITPFNANENDILKAEFGDIVYDEKSLEIKWFVNDQLISDFNNQIFVRLDVSSGDIVKYDAKFKKDFSFVSSESLTISSSQFIVSNLRIDGELNPLSVISIRPIFSWVVYSPLDREVNYVSIRIGTFFGSGNVLSQNVNTNKSTYRVPANVLEKGRDYFVSISVSDTNGFVNYTTSKFKITGSQWNIAVDNSIGWTFETSFLLESTSSFDEKIFQSISFNDGTRFAEIRIYNDKIGLFSSALAFSNTLDTSRVNSLTVVGKENDIKVYMNRKLIIDGVGLFVEPTTSKSLEIGNRSSEVFVASYTYFYYTVLGAFYPDSSSEYNELQFYKTIDFPLSKIVSLNDFVEDSIDTKIFGVNPQNLIDGGNVYKMIPGEGIKMSTVNRTFSPINNINLSPDGKNTIFSYPRGASIFNSYKIPSYTHQILLDDGNEVFPNNNGWDLVQNIGDSNSVYFDVNGLNVNTLFNE